MVRTFGCVYAGFPVGECVLVLGSVLQVEWLWKEAGRFCLTGRYSRMVSGRVAVVVVVIVVVVMVVVVVQLVLRTAANGWL